MQQTVTNEAVAGTVVSFNAVKGFGFIRPDGAAHDVYVHFTEIISAGFRSLEPQQRVSFRIKDGTRGKVAVGVRVRN